MTHRLAPGTVNDINSIAQLGASHRLGKTGRGRAPPLNLLGDFGGGSLYLIVGVLAALLEARHSGRGQVVDAAIVDGAASLLTFIYAALARGAWRDERGGNLLDGGAPLYTTYRCADGEYIAVSALEPPFHEVLIARLGLDQEAFKDRLSPESWPRLRQVLQQKIAQR